MAQNDQDVEDLLKEWNDAPAVGAQAPGQEEAKDGWGDGVSSAEMGLLTDGAAASEAAPETPAVADPADLLASIGEAPAAPAAAAADTAADDLLAELAAPAPAGTGAPVEPPGAAAAQPAAEAVPTPADEGWGDEAPRKDDDWGAEASAEDGWGEAAAPAPAAPSQSVDDLLSEMAAAAPVAAQAVAKAAPAASAPAEDWSSLAPSAAAPLAAEAAQTAPGGSSLEEQALAALAEDEDVKRLEAMGDGVTFRPPSPSLGARISASMYACLLFLLRPFRWALGRMEPRLRPMLVEKTGVTWHEWANGVIGAFVLVILVGLIFLGV